MTYPKSNNFKSYFRQCIRIKVFSTIDGTSISKATIGSENVFEDLGFEAEEAMNLRICADLMLDLRCFIQSQGWTQAEAATFFGETQPRISNLMKGDIDRFSIDKLVQMLGRAGMDVQVSVSNKAA
jgi:predicted XRE-type DNA-binding protein